MKKDFIPYPQNETFTSTINLIRMSKKELKDNSNELFEKAISALKAVLSDLNHVQAIINASMPNSNFESLTQNCLNRARVIIFQTDQGLLSVKEVSALNEEIRNLAELIIREKANNPLFSNELVTVISKTSKDAYLALELTEMTEK